MIPAIALTCAAAGCGSSSPSARRPARTPVKPAVHRRPAPVRLRLARVLGSLPAARSGLAVARLGRSIFVLGGLSQAGESTDTVFRVDARGRASTTGTLPVPVHDAAATGLSGRLLLLGGGQFEGSPAIVAVRPSPSRALGALPQPLSDLAAVAIGGVGYVVGGWNGTEPNRTIYAVRRSGSVSVAAQLPAGVRYPAAGALDGHLILAGGETAAGSPTRRAWSYDPATGTLRRLPELPFPTDHTAGAALDGRFYVLGGLRSGVFTSAILSWAPGESRWRAAGRLPAALADLGAVRFAGGIAVVGGRGSAGPVATVTLMAPA